MARLDHVKNMTGLVECYGRNTRLRELVNLVVVAGYIDVKNSKDREEIAEIEKMHDLMKKYNLDGQFRWIVAQTNRARNGELYRYIADTRGAFVQVYVLIMLSNICYSYQRIFVVVITEPLLSHLLFLMYLWQPAFYEAFGLTVVEAMTCGLPTFATCHGGPAEIIEHGVSGFHIDPYHPDQTAELMADFFQMCKEDSSHWNKISDRALQRIYERLAYSDRIFHSFTISYQFVRLTQRS